MEKILKDILEKINDLDSKVSNLDIKVGSLDNKVNAIASDQKLMRSDITNIKDSQNRLEKKVDIINNQTAELTEYKAYNIEVLNKMSNDIIFIKHKLNKNEEDIFDIKNNIKLAK